MMSNDQIGSSEPDEVDVMEGAGSSGGGSGNHMYDLAGVAVGDHVDDQDFSDDGMGIVGGHATNLDGLDKD